MIGVFLNMSLIGKFAVVLAVVLVALLLVVGVTLPWNYEVLQKGKLLDYTDGRIYQLRLYDSFNIFIEPEIKANKDFFTGMILAAIAFVSMTFATCLHKFGVRGYAISSNIFIITTVGFLFLAADELLGLHESAGHNLQFLNAIPGIQRPDDFIIMSYGVIALLVLVYFRNMLWEQRRAGRWFVVAIVLFGMSALADVIGFPYEEYIELLGAVFILVGIMSLGLMSLGAQISQGKAAAGGVQEL